MVYHLKLFNNWGFYRLFFCGFLYFCLQIFNGNPVRQFNALLDFTIDNTRGRQYNALLDFTIVYCAFKLIDLQLRYPHIMKQTAGLHISDQNQ